LSLFVEGRYYTVGITVQNGCMIDYKTGRLFLPKLITTFETRSFVTKWIVRAATETR